jgi:NDP-sugar pyrophosphorylase family protein
MQIIPLAGKGSRFLKEGYKISKYLLTIQGKTVLEHILFYFDRARPSLLILNEEDNNIEVVESILNTLGFKDFDIVEISDTNGQLTSVVRGFKKSRFSSYSGPVWIFNGDTVRRKNISYSLFDELKCDGIIEVFLEKGDHWSFVDVLGPVSKISEKERISDFCCTGLYGFRNIQIVIELFDNGRLLLLKNELYVSSLYNRMLDEGMIVCAFESARFDFLLCGTPEEYSRVISEFGT